MEGLRTGLVAGRNGKNLFTFGDVMKIVCYFILLLVLALPASPAAAQQRDLRLPDLLRELVSTHDRVQAAEAALQSAEHLVNSAEGAYLPSVDLDAEGGVEEIDRPLTKATQKNRNEQRLRASQLLYDFGGREGSVESAEAVLEEFTSRYEQARQEVIIKGVRAYLMIIRSREMLKYAVKSERSIQELSGMQEALVERGAGLSYEELQVKAQLAGTQAHRVNVERALMQHRNNFRAVFGFDLTQQEIQSLPLPQIPRELLPADLESAIETALADNPFLTELDASIRKNRAALKSREADYYPSLSLVAEGERKENDQGTEGVRTEGRGQLELSYNLFSGFSDMEAVKSAKQDIIAVRKTQLDRRRTVEERVRNSWLDLMTLRRNVELYQNQANINWEFLQAIKKKRELGEEINLLSILIGERDYINAISAKVAADIDTISAGYGLLYEMGQISVDLFRM